MKKKAAIHILILGVGLLPPAVLASIIKVPTGIPQKEKLKILQSEEQ